MELPVHFIWGLQVRVYGYGPPPPLSPSRTHTNSPLTPLTPHPSPLTPRPCGFSLSSVFNIFSNPKSESSSASMKRAQAQAQAHSKGAASSVGSNANRTHTAQTKTRGRGEPQAKKYCSGASGREHGWEGGDHDTDLGDCSGDDSDSGRSSRSNSAAGNSGFDTNADIGTGMGGAEQRKVESSIFRAFGFKGRSNPAPAPAPAPAPNPNPTPTPDSAATQPLHFAGSPSDAAANPQQQPQPPRSPDRYWVCPQCTYPNPWDTATSCASCNITRQKQKQQQQARGKGPKGLEGLVGK